MIELREKKTGIVLASGQVDDLHLLHAQALSLEEMGLEVELIQPSVSESLAIGLGLNEHEIKDFQSSMREEVEEHEGISCHKGCSFN